MAPTRNLLAARRLFSLVPALLVISLALVSCGGGVDSGGTGSYACGPITGFGSIIVGGVRYGESMAEVRDEFGPRDRDDLKLGMVTDIEATAPTGSAGMPTANAMTVRFRSEIVGPVDAVDVPASTPIVLGQVVTIGPKTVFGFNGGLGSVHALDVVEVYGQHDAMTKKYTATRIDAATAPVAAYTSKTLNTTIPNPSRSAAPSGCSMPLPRPSVCVA